ncbi:glycosyltransferase family 4 protein [Vibrio vulnificus]|uniref:glycosyltransferase family 4 protein n=1 Tax=Vibrio vulnificus TaxID=672 RepID=UPI001CDBF30D|nr:glycosyltransferase family 4 protein [Vibrio vulnificus]MCA3963744.1 glycosyltransferase family 4 protein [Vibrio vulnificus]
MRIIQVVPKNVNSGPVNVAKDLNYGLLKSNVESDVFFLRNNRSILYNAIGLYKKIKEKNIDVIHSHGIIPDFVCFLISMLIKVQWVTTIHIDPLEDMKFIYPKTYKLICRVWILILRIADQVVFLTPHIKNKYQLSNSSYIINSRKPKFIPNGKSKISNRVGFCGALIERKNIVNLVECIHALPHRTLIVAGSGPLMESISRGVADNVNLLGFRDDLEDFWQEIDILILPSFAEGVPLVAVEALQRRIPIILQNLENYIGVFSDKEAFFLDTLTPLSLDTAINAIYDKYDIYQSNCEKASTHQFSFKNWSDAYKNIYRKIVNE